MKSSTTSNIPTWRRALLVSAAAFAVAQAGLTQAAPEEFATSVVNTTGLAVTDDTVTVGILHSITGTMAISETGSTQAEKLAIKQINESGVGSSNRIYPGRWRQ